MSQLQLKRISKEIIDHAEEVMVPPQGLPRMVDDFFMQRLKEEEMQHAEVDPRLYESLRKLVKTDVVPLYDQFRLETARFRDRRHGRKLWQYVLGTVGVCEVLEAVLTRGKSILPMVLIPSAIFYCFVGFIIYTAAQYFDDRLLARARKRLENAIANLEDRVQTDVTYDQRRQLLDADILRSEVVEILTHYEKPSDFWRDYRRIRAADPTSPGDLKRLEAPAFNKFLKFHVDGQYSEQGRQLRFDRLFIEAHEVLLNRDRDHYVMEHLNTIHSPGT
jgi:hypothetical protein